MLCDFVYFVFKFIYYYYSLFSCNFINIFNFYLTFDNNYLKFSFIVFFGYFSLCEKYETKEEKV